MRRNKSEPIPTRSHAPQGAIILSGGLTRYKSVMSNLYINLAFHYEKFEFKFFGAKILQIKRFED